MSTDLKILEMIKRNTPSLYLLDHYTIRGKPITFEIAKRHYKKALNHRPWQVSIIDDQHKDRVVQKSRQLGLSELGVGEVIWFLDTHNHTKAMTTFPRSRQMTDFVKTRVNPVLDSNKYFQSILDPNLNSLEVKKFRDSFLLFRSAWGSALGEGADIDYLSFDEYDRMGDNVELAFQESMKSSRHNLLRRWSTPTIPGRGVNLQFQKSDQRFYMHKCEKCNEWQILSMEDNIYQVKPNGINFITEEVEPGSFDFICAKCHEPLDRWYNGQWVAKYPDRATQIDLGIRGYHISQLNAVWISADDIMRRQFRYKSKQLFRNYVIGEPYASEGLIITDDDILAAKRYQEAKLNREGYTKIVAGIDWGKINWCVLLGIKENGQVDLLNLWWFRDDDHKPLAPVLQFALSIRPYNPDLIVADFGYGADRNTYLQQQFPGRVFACKYVTIKNGSKFMDAWNEKSKEVSVDKTLKTQRLLHTLKARQIGLWAYDEKIAMFAKHVKNVRIMDEEGDDGEVYQIATRIGDDHLFASANYAFIGVEKLKDPYMPKSTFMFDFMND